MVRVHVGGQHTGHVSRVRPDPGQARHQGLQCLGSVPAGVDQHETSIGVQGAHEHVWHFPDR